MYITDRTIKPTGNHIEGLCLHLRELAVLPLLVNSWWSAFLGWNVISLILLLLWLPSYSRKGGKESTNINFNPSLRMQNQIRDLLEWGQCQPFFPPEGPAAGKVPRAWSEISALMSQCCPLTPSPKPPGKAADTWRGGEAELDLVHFDIRVWRSEWQCPNLSSPGIDDRWEARSYQRSGSQKT